MQLQVYAFQFFLACTHLMVDRIYLALDLNAGLTAANTREDSIKFVNNVCDSMSAAAALSLADKLDAFLADANFQQQQGAQKCANFAFQANEIRKRQQSFVDAVIARREAAGAWNP